MNPQILEIPAKELDSSILDRLKEKPDAEDTVLLTVAVKLKSQSKPTSLARFRGRGKGGYSTPAEAVNSIRELRDEWPH